MSGGHWKSVCKRGHDLSQTRRYAGAKMVGCYECFKILASVRYHNNKPKFNVRSRQQHLKRKYGLSLEAFNEMLVAQHGRCAICGDELRDGFRRHVDHDHTTGRVRALLCNDCNRAIGLLKDDPMRAYRVATYLERHRLKLVS